MLPTVVFIVAMFVTMILIPPLMRAAVVLGVIDIPDARKVHVKPIPRIGGLAMIIGTLLPLIIWMEQPDRVFWFLLGVVIIAIFGLWDDRTPLDYRIKFFGQLLAIACVVFGADLHIRYLPLGEVFEVPMWFSIPFTAFALLGIINAINLADGLDGLAGGTTFISVAAIALLAYLAGDNILLVLCTAVLGCIVGFLRFNTHPAQIFMGDGGSQFLGFSVGVFAIMLTQYSTGAMSPVSALLLLGLPILDTFLVMGQRIAEGRSPFKPDKNHIHHRLLGLGFDHYEAVVIIYMLQAIMVVSGVLMRFEQDWLNMAWFVFFCGAVLITIRVATKSGWNVRGPNAAVRSRSPIVRWFESAKRLGFFTHYPLGFIAVAIPGLMVSVLFGVSSVPPDTAMALSVLLLIAVIGLLFGRGHVPIGLSERLVICTTIIAALYYGTPDTGSEGRNFLLSLENYVYAGMVLATVLIYRFSASNPFRITPMDFLVVFTVMVIPNLMTSLSFRAHLGEIAAKTLVLYYGSELIIANFEKHRIVIRGILVAMLTLLCLRSSVFT